MFIVLDDLMRILRKTQSTPLLAVIFECLFVFCFDQRARRELMTTYKLEHQLDIAINKEGLSKIVTDLRKLIGKLDSSVE
jgi:hypothetical protein